MKASAVFVSALFLFAAGASAQTVTDAQIAAIVVTANQVDVDAGKLAAATTRNAEIRKFAQLMVDDHTGVNTQAVALVTRLKVTPEDSDTSRSLKTDGEKHIASLKTLKGAAFDKAYVDHEVAYHQAVLDALDKILIPGATNAELKALLVKVRPAFIAHLEHARHLASSLTGKPVTHTVVVDSSRFSPAELTVNVGDSIVWVNKDIVAHTATSVKPGFDSKMIQPGASWRFTSTTRGVFEYSCSYHPMNGILRVK
jgi:putative membrane protein